MVLVKIRNLRLRAVSQSAQRTRFSRGRKPGAADASGEAAPAAAVTGKTVGCKR